MAVELARAVQAAGADGILLLPPYLVNGSQEGLAAHIGAVCKAVAHRRDRLQPGQRHHRRRHIGAPVRAASQSGRLGKDGVGDIELMTRIYTRMGDRLTYIGGLPTAETFAAPYLKMGVTTYSSAIFNFMPRWASAFYKAVRAEDQAKVLAGLRDFVMPYIALRNRGKVLCGRHRQGGHARDRQARGRRAPAIDRLERARAGGIAAPDRARRGGRARRFSESYWHAAPEHAICRRMFELSQLRCFVVTAEELHFRSRCRAAEHDAAAAEPADSIAGARARCPAVGAQ